MIRVVFYLRVVHNVALTLNKFSHFRALIGNVEFWSESCINYDAGTMSATKGQRHSLASGTNSQTTVASLSSPYHGRITPRRLSFQRPIHSHNSPLKAAIISEDERETSSSTSAAGEVRPSGRCRRRDASLAEVSTVFNVSNID